MRDFKPTKTQQFFGRSTPQKRKKKTFCPDRNYVKSAVEDFLKSGGRIKRVVPAWDNFTKFAGHNDADDFLRESGF